MRKIFIIIMILSVYKAYCQDVEFSQYYANPLYLNPAFAGSDEFARVSLNYRTILPTSFGDYSTYSASFDKYYEALSGGIGFQIMNDKQAQGVISDLGFSLLYSYHTQLKKRWSLATGFRIGYNIKTLNSSGLVYPDMIDPVNGISNSGMESELYQKSLYFDFSFGMLTWYENYFGGITIDHITKPQISLGSDDPGPIERKYTIHGGMEIPFYNNLRRVHMTMSPNLIFQMQGASSKLNLGVYLNKNFITSGVWLKTNTNFNLTGCVLMFGYLTDYSTFSYSYDVPFYLGDLSGIISGGHEVTFLYKFMYKRKRKKMKAIKCPKI
ncbi:MAG: PorP/SprF family type IX secretion system membrane protein [Bacteroidales bacterium]|jgi:type IX secretion system PorP/SprF family membrane protein|nr:PorP/SprF family type IX secretion system membrane protein [Bacteroidales bacterium]